jgi:hypothetical protein
VPSRSEICLTVDVQSEVVNLKNTGFQNNIEEHFKLALEMLVSLELGFEQSGRTFQHQYQETFSSIFLFILKP